MLDAATQAGATIGGRRTASILAADVVGSTRLMAADEARTLAAIRHLRGEVIEPAAARAGGRLFKAMGDGFLLEFPRAEGALRCALDIQQSLRQAESGLWLRIGLHESEVSVAEDGSDLLGDGVNVAVRLETLAEPGGVVASARVQVAAAALGITSADLGERELRNLPNPVRVFRIEVPGRAAGPARLAPIAARPEVDATGFAERPSIAVLPFRHRGGDAAEQEHLADGVTEEVIHALARWRFLPVVARGSVFAFKGRDVDPREIRRQLGARYVVEGSVRRRDDALRLDALLVDAETGTTLLSESFSAPLGTAELEDAVARGVVGALEPALLRHETARVADAGPDSPSAYTRFLRGLWHHYRYTEDDNGRARAFLAQALDLAPSYAKATATLALAELMATHYRRPGRDREGLFASALQHGETAAMLDPADPTAHFARGTALLMGGRSLTEAEAALRRAVALDPCYAAAHANLGSCLNGLDRPAEAFACIDTALRFSPQDPRRFIWLAPKSISHYLLGDYAAAIGVAREVLALKRDAVMVLRPLVAALGQLGLAEAAAPFLAGLHRLDGGPAETERHLATLYRPAVRERLLEGLRRAGYG